MQVAASNLFHSLCRCTRHREQNRHFYGAMAVSFEICNLWSLGTGFLCALYGVQINQLIGGTFQSLAIEKQQQQKTEKKKEKKSTTRNCKTSQMSGPSTMSSPALQGALKDGFRDCRGAWHTRTVRVSILWQLPEEVPVGPQGGWCCFAPSCWSCAPSRRSGEVS